MNPFKGLDIRSKSYKVLFKEVIGGFVDYTDQSGACRYHRACAA